MYLCLFVECHLYMLYQISYKLNVEYSNNVPHYTKTLEKFFTNNLKP